MITQEKLKKLKGVAEMIVEDMESDANALDGKPFTGKTLAELMGTHYAVTRALAKIIVELVDDKIEKEPEAETSAAEAAL